MVSLKSGVILAFPSPDPTHDPLHKADFDLQYPPVTITLHGLIALAVCTAPSNPEDTFFALTSDKQLRRYHVPKPAAQGTAPATLPAAGAGATGKFLKPGTVLALSPDGRWVAGSGGCGSVTVLSTHDFSFKVTLRAHSPHEGGTAALSFTDDGMHLLSSGRDGGLLCWQLGDTLADRPPPPRSPMTGMEC